jgi:hypothetical protein
MRQRNAPYRCIVFLLSSSLNPLDDCQSICMHYRTTRQCMTPLSESAGHGELSALLSRHWWSITNGNTLCSSHLEHRHRLRHALSEVQPSTTYWVTIITWPSTGSRWAAIERLTTTLITVSIKFRLQLEVIKLGNIFFVPFSAYRLLGYSREIVCYDFTQITA